MAERTIPLFPRGVANTSSSFFTNLINAVGGILVSPQMIVTGNETVTSTNTNNGDLVVCGTVTINGDLDIGGSLNVAGSTITPTPSGSIMPYAGGPIPPSAEWLLCDGASYLTTAYSDLFNAIGYTYGGAGPNFNVPDLRGRVAVGQDLGAGVHTSNNTLGDTSGSETHSLTEAELPMHTHTAITMPGEGTHIHTWSASDSTMPGEGTHTNTATANGESHTHNLTYTTVIGRDMAGAGESWNLVTLLFENIFFGQELPTFPVFSGAATAPVVVGGGGHSHILTATGTTTGEDGHTHTINSITTAGNGDPHENKQPYIVLNYVIKT